GFASAYTYLTYAFEVTGTNGVVPISVSAFGSASGLYNGGSYQASLDVYMPGGGPTVIFQKVDQGAPGSFSVNGVYKFDANTPYYVTMSAFGFQTGGSWSASVDPLFVIDPDFANNYTLEFSPGIVNTIASVP